MCASDAPVCPPMWNAPIPPIPNYTAPIPPILPTFHRVPRPLGEVEAVPQTGASFGSRPLGPTPGSSSVVRAVKLMIRLTVTVGSVNKLKVVLVSKIRTADRGR